MDKHKVESRNLALERIGWANATLKCAISTINTGEEYEGSVKAVADAKGSVKQQIHRIRADLKELERLL